MTVLGKIFRQTFLYLFLLELFSLCGYLIPEFRPISFFVVLAVFLVICYQKLEWGILIILAELFVGSKGYLFYFEVGNVSISIRIAFWLILIGVWMIQNLQNFKNFSKKYLVEMRYSVWYLPLFLMIAWGVINGYLRQNEFSNLFFDFNGWLYILLLFPVMTVINTKEQMEKIMSVFMASAAWLSVKTMFLLYVFSHNLVGMNWELYRWVRTTGVGEITHLPMLGNFYRIFFQSHVFVLVAFVFCLYLLFKQIFDEKTVLNAIRKKLTWFYFFLTALFLTINVINLSRSNWVGLILCLALSLLSIWLFHSFKQMAISVLVIIMLSALSLGIISAVTYFPWPEPQSEFSLSLFSGRSNITTEAGASSRWSLLPKLWDQIKADSILGKGFGATVTYITSDPRIVESNPSGEYTTFAFEWGWLDIWLKMGVLGVAAYLFLIFSLLKQGRTALVGISAQGGAFLQSLLIGVVMISTISFFSPYLNHPLGIGLIILATVAVKIYSKVK